MRSSRGRSRMGKSSSSISEKEVSKRSGHHQESGFEEWGGYREAKKQKLHDQFYTEDKGSKIFKGVAVYINGYTKPSSDELRKLLTQHGGRFEQYLYKRQVTHIVATNIPDSKIHGLKAMKVVRPEWITDSVKAEKLLPYTSYLLYGTASNPMTAFGESVTHSTRLPMPSANLEMDSTRLLLPSASLEMQSTRLPVPSANMEMDSTRLLLPSASLEMQSTRLPMPSANLEMDSTRLLLPSVNLKMQSTRLTVPSANSEMSHSHLTLAPSSTFCKSDVSSALNKPKNQTVGNPNNMVDFDEQDSDEDGFFADSEEDVSLADSEEDVSLADNETSLKLPLPSLQHCDQHLSLTDKETNSNSPTSLQHCDQHLSLTDKETNLNPQTSLQHYDQHLSLTDKETNLNSQTSLQHCDQHLSLTDKETNLNPQTSLQHCDQHLSLTDKETNSNPPTYLQHCDQHLSLTDKETNPNPPTYLQHCDQHLSLTNKETNSNPPTYLQHCDQHLSLTDKETNSNPPTYLQHCDQHLSLTDKETNSNPPTSLHDNEIQSLDQKNKTAQTTATASDPGFVAEFYSHSRLHHISTSGAQFKEYVSQLQKQSDGQFPGREKLRQFHLKRLARTGSVDDVRGPVRGRPDKVIMHIDMDCFFVSVGLRDRPELVGKPVAVTHSKGKESTARQPGGQTHVAETTTSQSGHQFSSMAEIASCSYEARHAGVKNGMFMGPALKLCPRLIPIPYEFDKYQQVSQTLYDTVASYTHDIEAVSCDEMLIDCTDLLADTGATPLDFVSVLREEIKNKTGCNASAGIASNILLARLSTRSAKPNGQFHLEAGHVSDFMAKQSVKDLPGVGWSMARKLALLNLKTCGDLQKISLATLQKDFGPKTGQTLYKFCRGEDYRQIKVEKERKSVSAEINYGIRFNKDTEAVKFVGELSEEVCNRLKQLKKKGKTITLKLMIRKPDAPKETPKYLGHGKCTHFSKSSTLPVSTDDVTTVAKECISILKSQRIDTTDIRGVGIQINRLESRFVGPTLGGDNHQSILNFAVAQKRSSLTKDTPSTVTEKSSVPSPCTTQALDTTEKHGNVISSYKNLDPSDNFTDDVLDDDVLGNDFTDVDASLTDVGSTSFHCSNSTILEELSRRRNAKQVPPPLPTLPDMFASPETPKVESVNSKDYFPSPSQIDPEVLKELPPDIRIQVEKDMNMRRSQRNQVAVTKSKPRGSSQEPGCSHWSGLSVDLANQKTVLSDKTHPSLAIDRESKNTDFGALPSPSQLDISCLNALPEELQKEIRMGYAQQNRTIGDPPRRCSHNMLQLQQATSPSKKKPSPNKSRSPTKTASPNKGSRKSPVFKIPRGRRGRKKKLSAKKLEFVEKPTRVEQEKTVEMRAEDDEDILISASTQDPGQQDSTYHLEDEVNLCGAVNIGQVRILLAEWLESSPVPQEEDLTAMTSYLGQLVEDRNLEMVDLVLKCLHRKIKQLVNKLWRTTFMKILNSTQDIVFACYGCCLKTDWLTRN